MIKLIIVYLGIGLLMLGLAILIGKMDRRIDKALAAERSRGLTKGQITAGIFGAFLLFVVGWPICLFTVLFKEE